jgi:pSer/pThr/pTyr-binding forkhead associated (FHA) protein
MANSPGKPPRGAVEPVATRLESDEEIQEALAHVRRRAVAKPAPQQQPSVPPPPVAEPEPDVQPDAPVQRPPMAMLCILDDGKQDGEWVRIRAERTVIGRAAGAVQIPHDGLMSGQHAEIVRQRTDNGYRWVLLDLESTNGSFVRVHGTVLRHNNELLIGSGRYRFENSAPPPVEPDQGPAQSTKAWTESPVRSLHPSLVEVLPAGPGQRFTLSQQEYWMGRDPAACAIARPGDMLASPRHARLHRNSKNQWHIESNKAPNGVWFRIDEIPLGKACQIRLGEQKFLFRVV